MIIKGVDFHPEFQQIAWVDTDSGELEERQLRHREEAEAFYRGLVTEGKKVRVGMEASGHARWFERLLGELKFELWIGDAAEIRTKRVRKQKTDRQDAQLILKLLLEDRFPRIWVPSWENRDLRQLLWHRHRMVQACTRIMNQLQAVALNEGLRCKKRLWGERGRQQLESFRLAPWASRPTEEMHGSDRVSDLRGLRREPWLDWAFFPLERNGALLSSACRRVLEKCLTPPTLSERRFFTSYLRASSSRTACFGLTVGKVNASRCMLTTN